MIPAIFLKILGSILLGGAANAANEMKRDQFGLDGTDRDYIKALHRAVENGEISEDEAISRLDSKGVSPDVYYAYGNGNNGSTGDMSDNFLNSTNSFIQNIGAKYFGNGLTDSEKQAMLYNRQERLSAEQFNSAEAQKSRDFTMYMAQNKYQMETQSMQNAGVNPAMVYGGGNLVPTAANGASASSPSAGVGLPSQGNLSDIISGLMAMVRMPLELKQLKAEIHDTEASAALKRQQKLTEEAETRIRSINANYQEVLNGQTVNNMKADYDNTVADTGVKKATQDKVKNEADAQRILNQYLDERQQAEIAEIKAQKGNLDASAAKSRAEKIYQDWYNGFVQANGFLPSSNDWLLIGTYIASLFGVAKEDVQSWFNDIMDNIPGWTEKKRRDGKGGATDSTGVPHAGSEGSTGKLSR